MAKLFEEMAGLDKLIHEPARLAILTALSSCKQADFLFLQRLTGLTKGNLSSHLSKLESAEVVEINKQFIGKKPNTFVTLTAKGRLAIDLHWRQLEKLRHQVQQWKPNENESVSSEI